ncbi:MAG: RuvX/YqgF family protein, partial [Pseudomonadota bacterium]
MSVLPLEDIAVELPQGKVLAGLDLGTKTIGLAVSDLRLSLATPRPLIKRTKFTRDAVILLERLAKENVGACVIGLP